MMTVILFFVFLFIIAPLLGVIFRVWMLARGIKRGLSRQFGGGDSSGTDDKDEEQADDGDASRMDSAIGQYVDFEEILCERNPIAPEADTPIEPRISDAHFEEIP